MTQSLKVSPLENIRVGIKSTIGPGGKIDSSWNRKLCYDLNVYLKKIGADCILLSPSIQLGDSKAMT